MHIRYQDTAEADLDHIKRYLSDKSPQGLARILSAIFTTADQLEDFPLIGREGEIAGTRELIVPRTNYRLVYVINEPYYVDILRVLHAKLKYPPSE